ncbi:DUF7931 domain-containing protein [Thauera sinica]|uniref:DUF7931 domain-containing protein n=1 Tax=Thauera sinica TaxID=2665146 RepID=A0ABW1APB6_9RHOO|nr:hypothetical protein [Thauera sp. K11]ATE59382.1 hypothetical protein CCZ27_04960 [Thauera sp. K11]
MQEYAFDTYAAYREHVLDAVRHATRSLVVFDRDLAQTGFESSAGIEALDTLARNVVGDEAIRILVCSPEHIEQYCPRLLKLVERYGRRMRIRVVGESVAHPDASFIVGDGSTLVTRFHHDRARGKRVDGPGADTSRHTAQFETMWVSAKDGPTGAPLGI